MNAIDMRDFAIEVATSAAAIAMKGFRQPLDVQHKGRIDLLTEYDLAAERHVREKLLERFPTHRIVGEDAGAARTWLHLYLGAA